MSRVGNKPINLPAATTVKIDGTKVFVQGPKGKLEQDLPHRIKAEVKDKQIIVSRSSDSNLDKSLHGLSRNLIFNMVKGVNEEFTRELEIRGVGYRVRGYSYTGGRRLQRIGGAVSAVLRERVGATLWTAYCRCGDTQPGIANLSESLPPNAGESVDRIESVDA